MVRLICFFLLWLPLISSAANAKRFDSIPEPLKPWVEWVLHDQTGHECPFLYNAFNQKRCSWPGLLTLKLNKEKGQFNSHWTVFRAEWIVLPGSERNWPQNVTVNQKPALVMNRKGKPVVYLTKGHYQISGRFIWDSIPDNLMIPDNTGLLDLVVAEKKIHFPAVRAGSVWLKSSDIGRKKPENIQNTLDLRIFRKIKDTVPLQVLTYLELDVSGYQREVKLPFALLQGFVPIRLNSPLPARIEQDGSLLIQLRPGRWHIELNARYPDHLENLPFNVQSKKWPESEIWVFQAMPSLRMVEIKNLISVDPSQTNLPRQWHQFPAYLVNQGDTMGFKLLRRGDPEPEPNQLNLNRKLWLDFDGSGYTVHDRIIGKMTHGWRLDASPGLNLGQVEINGHNQLVTRMPGSTGQGVEVRKGNLDLSADSRINGSIDKISAVGWQQDFHQAKAELNIPPGWLLLAVQGVDNDPDSWISRWTLLDLFMVLIAALAVSRLWNIYWGLFTLMCLTLIWHEADAPRYIWLNILAAISLIRVLPESRFLTFVKGYRNASGVALLIIAIPFMVTQIRMGLYPQLEQQWQPITSQPYLMDQVQSLTEVESDGRIEHRIPVKKLSDSYSASIRDTDKSVNFNRIDPEANVQTGPGLPEWQWHRSILTWNGMVNSEQLLEFWYLSPPETTLLKFLQVASTVILSLLMFGIITRSLQLSIPFLSLTLILSLSVFPLQDVHASFPDQKLLNELKSRLLSAPECVPGCAQIPEMRISINKQRLNIVLKIHVQQDSAVPLPAKIDQWQPEQVIVDGNDETMMIRDRQGLLWLNLQQGPHRVTLQGINPEPYKFILPLPLKPHRIEMETRGWTVEGIHENGQADKQLQFTRIQSPQKEQVGRLPVVTELPPFIRIERTLLLGLDWRIQTRVIRVQPGQAAVLLEFPLLPEESVITENIRVKNNRVLVNMAADQVSFQWLSVLKKTEKIKLQAAQTDQWTELWRIDIAPVWHIQMKGIPAVHHLDTQGRWLPEWKPWPGEKLELMISRPQAVAGKTVTIDKSKFEIEPGKRSQLTKLILDIRSSKGGRHRISIPKQAILQSVTINGVTQPIRQNGETVTVPLKPGKQSIQFVWNENISQSTVLTTPSVNLGMTSVNSYIQLIIGHDRWVLLTWGPKFGPAALIWGVLIVILILSWGMGKIKLTPLNSRQWFLLLVGLSQIPVEAAIIVVIWLIALGLRAQKSPDNSSLFNFMQVMLGMLTMLALALLFIAVQQGLLGSPDMQIAGNQSTAFNLNWYQDRNDEWLPTASVVSVPLMFYRILMLLWSLWLAVSLLDWLKWGWACYSKGDIWKKRVPEKRSLLVKEGQGRKE